MGTRKNRLTEAVLTCIHNLCLEQNMKIIKTFQLKIVIFTVVKNCIFLYAFRWIIEIESDNLTVSNSEIIIFTDFHCL